MSGGRVAVRLVLALAVVAVIGKYSHPATAGPTGASGGVAAPVAGHVAAAAGPVAGGIPAQARAVFGGDYGCAAQIISHESSWNPHAVNPSSGAYGLPQALPAGKLAAAGPDWRDNPATQLAWMRSYVDSRYGGACPAWAWWQTHHWY